MNGYMCMCMCMHMCMHMHMQTIINRSSTSEPSEGLQDGTHTSAVQPSPLPERADSGHMSRAHHITVLLSLQVVSK